MLRVRLLLTLLVADLAIALPTTAALACFNPNNPSMEERLQTVDLVFTGTVLGTDYRSEFAMHLIQVDQYLKGSGPTMLMVSGFTGSFISTCSVPLYVGDTGLFFIDGNPLIHDTFYATYGTARGVVRPITAENINEVMQFTTQLPTAPTPTPLSLLLQSLSLFPSVQVILFFMILVSFNLAAIAVARHHNKVVNIKNQREALLELMR